MKKKILMLALLGACTSSPLMTVNDFSNIDIGTSIAQVEKKYGHPVRITSDQGERQVYEYIERISMGTQLIEMRRYYIVVKGGKVVNKYVKYSNPPPYEDIYTDDPFPDQDGQ